MLFLFPLCPPHLSLCSAHFPLFPHLSRYSPHLFLCFPRLFLVLLPFPLCSEVVPNFFLLHNHHLLPIPNSFYPFDASCLLTILYFRFLFGRCPRPFLSLFLPFLKVYLQSSFFLKTGIV